MANFRYKGRGNRGDLVEGIIDAASADAVASQLINTGITPIDIQEVFVRVDVLTDLRARLAARRVDLDDLILFARQMYTLLRAGVPMTQALTGLVRSARNPTLAESLKDVQASLESGRDLSTSLAQHPKIYPSIFVNTVRIGENTGRLDDAFLKLSAYLDLEKDTRARIKSALRYPTFVIVAIGIAVFVINVVVVPQFAAIFERAGVDLPLPTRILVGTSDFFVDYWVFLLAGLAFLIAGARIYVSTDAGRYTWDKLKLRIPIIGDILFRATLGRFARSFSMSLSAGVPLIQALVVVSRAVDNEYVGDRILNMRNGVERGDSLSRTAAATGMFTPLVLQMMAVGEETGQMDTLLEEVAGFYEREVDYDIKNLSQTIEPILIVVIAGMVLVLALGVFLPMWDLASVKLGR
jgi:MSHA biogenesis protein MshG